ncbi:hypothetical protein RB601_007945 [Gaeumannomyces tritici]
MSSEDSQQNGPNPVSGDKGPGTGLLDLLPIPADTQPVTDPERTETSNSLHQDTTLSHALATDDHQEKGLLQKDHQQTEVADLGWNEKKQNIAEPLMGGMSNEELWILVRRFNKQMYHVKAVPYAVPGNLDLNVADEEEFSPDKLRANLERLYTTVIVGVLAAVKHVARLRSWRETRRTTSFCAAYFFAWAFDFLVPLLTTTVLVLVVYEPSRAILFPPAPMALVSTRSGGVQKPKSGILGSHDSATGAPENHKGEAVEQEASNFVNGIASVALSSAVGKHPQDEPASEEGNLVDDAGPDPTAVAVGAADAKEKASGNKPHGDKDKTKVPMETAMWTKMRPIMHGIADVADTWERFANALSPTPPFPQETYRLRIATLVLPLVVTSLVVSSYAFTKAVMAGVGFTFFGDPIITRGLDWLNRKVPNWQQLIEVRNTALKGVPTNAQLTLTLLRIGEANRAPIPPPPRVSEAPPDEPAAVTDSQLRATGAEPPLNATDAELDAAMRHDPHTKHETGGADIDAARDPKHGKKSSRILGFFKGTSKGGVKTAIGTDTVRAKVLGSRHAKERLGVVPPKRAEADVTSGPVEFKARHGGRKGHVYLGTAATPAVVAFSTETHNSLATEVTGGGGVKGNHEEQQQQGGDDKGMVHAMWSVAVSDIVELKKFGGYGWKAKLLVGWSLERKVEDGLEIKTTDGKSYRITACPLRDELFNRLISMGGQKWEAW